MKNQQKTHEVPKEAILDMAWVEDQIKILENSNFTDEERDLFESSLVRNASIISSWEQEMEIGKRELENEIKEVVEAERKAAKAQEKVKEAQEEARKAQEEVIRTQEILTIASLTRLLKVQGATDAEIPRLLKMSIDMMKNNTTTAPKSQTPPPTDIHPHPPTSKHASQP